MTINRSSFFAACRSAPFDGFLRQSQVDGINRILDEWERRGIVDNRCLGYMLATVFHETARLMQPIREGGGEIYLRSKPYWPWVGEGLVQVTWEVNARKFGATKPGDCMSWPVAMRALYDGMLSGMFTGRKLSDYFSATIDDPVGARRIINGTDKADLIAGYYRDFMAAIRAGLAVTAVADDAPPIPSPGPAHIDVVKASAEPKRWWQFWRPA